MSITITSEHLSLMQRAADTYVRLKFREVIERRVNDLDQLRHKDMSWPLILELNMRKNEVMTLLDLLDDKPKEQDANANPGN